MRLIWSAVCLVLSALGARADCADIPTPCEIDMGQYHIALPDTAETAPVMVFLHGAGGSGAGVLRNRGLVNAVTDRGYAFVAPSALPRRAGQSGGIWNFYPDWDGRDETAFLAAAVTDAAARFGTSADRVLLAGFSAGAFMVTYLACETPQQFQAYAPLAGAFWEPHPQACAGPVKLFQTHGWRDSTVPLEGRPLGGGRFLQGDVFASLTTWRQANACPNMAPDAYAETGVFLRRVWTDCAPGSALELALHPGGHAIPRGWADMVLAWFEAQVP